MSNINRMTIFYTTSRGLTDSPTGVVSQANAVRPTAPPSRREIVKDTNLFMTLAPWVTDCF